MKQDGIDWDISVWHMYGEDPEWAFKELARYGHPIWVTEFNNPLGSQRSDEQQADGLRQAMMRLRELHLKYKVEAAHVYELLDETYWAPNFEAYMGLVKLVAKSDGGWAIGEPKPAYAAAREVILGKRPVVRPKRDCEISEVSTSEPLSVRQGRFAYCLVLGHRKDAGGIARWVQALENGETNVTEMVLTLMQSEEFNRRYATFWLTARPVHQFSLISALWTRSAIHMASTIRGHLSGGTMTGNTLPWE